jgi:hypothetical protein
MDISIGERICKYHGKLPSKCDGTSKNNRECLYKDNCLKKKEAKEKREEAITDMYDYMPYVT